LDTPIYTIFGGIFVYKKRRSCIIQVYKFNTHGDYLGPLSVKVKGPREFFKDDDNNIWVCDFGNSRLLAVDLNGNVIDAISLKGIWEDTCELVHPGCGCLNGDRFYLILWDDAGRKQRVVSIDRSSPHNSLEILPSDMLQSPVSIQSFEQDLYVGDSKQGIVFTYDFDHKKYIRFSKCKMPNFLRRFVKCHDGVLISSENSILKISPNGREIFIANLERIIPGGLVRLLGISVSEKRDMRILFVIDKFQACIHKFEI